MIRVQGTSVSEAGGRIRNEDSVLVEPERGVFGVADGMGGMDSGDEASKAVVEALAEHLRQPCEGAGQDEQHLERLDAAVAEANDRLIDDASKPLARRGSTVSMVWIQGTTGYCAHIGDSRIYQLREGLLRQITRDHSVVQDLVDSGQLRPEDRRSHPQRHMITRALGIDRVARCEFSAEPLRDGDRLLICTDGLSNALSDHAICTILSEIEAQKECVRELVDSALRAHTDDNVSAVVVDVLGEREG